MSALARTARIAAVLLLASKAGASEAPEPEPELALASERGLQGGRVGYNFGTDTLYRTVGQDNRRRLLLDDEGEAEPEAAAAPGPEYDLAADRSSIAMDPATLSDVTLRYGTYLPEIQAGLGRRRLLEAEAEAEAEAEPEIGEAVAHLLSDATELAGDVMTGVAEAFAAAPSPEADLASERGRLGGRVGYNFGTGTLYTQNRYNDRLRRHLLEEAEAEAEAEAEPEIGEAVTHLLSDATELAGDVMTGIAEAFAPMEEAMERGRLTNRVGFNANTGQSWQFTGGSGDTIPGRRLLEEEEAEAELEEAEPPKKPSKKERRKEKKEAAEQAALAAAAAPGPEDEYDLSTARSSITLDPATLSRPELRYGAYAGQIVANGK